MGQEIVYCHKCSSRLTGAEFEKGKAVRIRHLCYCQACSKEALAALPEDERERALAPQREAAAQRFADKVLPDEEPEAYTPPSGSRHIGPRPGTTSRRGATPEETKSSAPLLLGILGAAAAAIALLVLALPGGRTPSTAPSTTNTSTPDPKPDPATVKTPDPTPVHRPPVAVDPMEREKSAKSALQSAQSYKRSGPRDLPNHVDLYERAAREAVGTSVEAAAKDGLDKIRGELKTWMASEVGAVEKQLKALLDKGDLKGAVDLLNRERARHSSLEWTAGLRKAGDDLYSAAKAAFPPLKQKALAAQARGAANEVAALREQVSHWGFATLLDTLDKELALVPLGTNPNPATDPPPAVETGLPSTKDGLAWQAVFDKAAAHLLARDAKAAVSELEAALPKIGEAPVKAEAQADLDAFRLVEPALAEAAAALAKWPRWQNLAVTYVDEAGKPRAIDEPVYRVEDFHAEVRGGAVVPFGEIAGASLVELARPARKPGDLKAAAVLAALEGDAAAAQRLKLPALPARYAAFAAKAAGLAREGEARALFHEAAAAARSYATLLAAAEKFAKLQKDYAETAFVRRNGAAIRGRDEIPKEFFFGPGDLAGAGNFRLRRHPKGETAWTMNDDVADPARRAEHYVDLAFSVPPDAEAKAWVYAGGCCLETFTFWVQGTEITTVDPATKVAVPAEPGGPAAATAFPKVFLKKDHAAHQPAPKEPTRWEWVALPLPAKYGAGGAKTIRILSDQEGFSVAWALVSLTRKTAPTGAEGRELEKTRPAPEVVDSSGMKTGSILREFWNGISDTKIPALTGNPNFPNRPSGKDLQPMFEAPRDFGDNYGMRMRGWVLPPAAGDYTFWLASDDDGELWLSTDESPASRQKLITQIGASGPRDWNDGRKKTVKLQKGRPYYVEALAKEGGGGDHLAVGWTLPDGTQERPIPGNRLAPYVAGALRGGVEFAAPADGTAFPAPGSIAVSANLTGGGAFSRIELWQGSTRVADLRSGSPPTYTWTAVPPGSYPLFLRGVEKTGGGSVLSAPSVVRVGDITFHRAVNLNGPACRIDGQPWEGSDAPDLVRAGTGFERPDAELRPATDSDRAAMIRASIASPEGTRASLTGTAPGQFLVYLYTWAKAEPQAFDLAVEGKTVLTGFRHAAAGDWARHGPFAVEVSDGAIDVQASKGTAHVSGIEVWRVGKPPPAPQERAKTALVGGPGGAAFEDAREAGTFLVGFRYNVSGRPIVKAIQPLFRKGAEAGEGDLHANPEGALKEIVAKPGYAVGGVTAQGNDRMAGFKITFMRITGPVLNPKDAYESEWIGGREGTETRLAGDGMPVIGIHGRQGNDLDAFGLVYLK